MAGIHMEDKICGNCGTAMAGEFCHACGQRGIGKIEFLKMIRESLVRFLDLDTGIFHTIRDLSVRPGAVAREYVAGTRQVYMNPVKYCFVMVTIYAVLINLLDIDLGPAMGLEFDEEERQISFIIHSVLAYLIFVVLIAVSWIQRRMFRDGGYTFGETYVFGLFTFGHITWLAIAMVASGVIETTVGLSALFLLQLAYLVWAMTGFYALSRPPLLRGFVVAISSSLCTNVLALGLGNLLSLLGLVEPLAKSIA